eukprot:9284305-Pyramimonas_sp.AAC.1
MLRQRHYPVDVLHAEVVEGLLRVRARLVPPDEYPLGREHHHEEQQEGLAAVEGNQGRALQDVRFGVLQSGNLDKGQEDDHDGVQREHLERGALEHLHRKGHLLVLERLVPPRRAPSAAPGSGGCSERRIPSAPSAPCAPSGSGCPPTRPPGSCCSPGWAFGRWDRAAEAPAECGPEAAPSPPARRGHARWRTPASPWGWSWCRTWR